MSEEGLLIRHGLDNVSLGNIAEAARLSRVTLYEYYPNKQEVAWAIFQKLIGEMQAGPSGRLPQSEGSGFQRIEHAMLVAVDLLKHHPTHLRFIVEFNTLYARGQPGSCETAR